MQTNTKTLERRLFPNVDPEKAMTENVLNYAQEQLGYRHPARDVLRKCGPLSKALQVAGITPFTDQSVEKYKIEQAAKHEDVVRKRFHLAIKLCFALIAYLVICGFVAYHTLQPVTREKVLTVCIFTGMFVMAVLFILFLASADSLEGKAEWRSISLKEYKNPVPGFALATAQEIHQRMPTAEFFIEELTVIRVVEVPRDPFLRVQLDTETYYVEVWEEPAYDQKRQV